MERYVYRLPKKCKCGILANSLEEIKENFSSFFSKDTQSRYFVGHCKICISRKNTARYRALAYGLKELKFNECLNCNHVQADRYCTCRKCKSTKLRSVNV